MSDAELAPAERYRHVRVPVASTLKRYGLSLSAWKALVREQGGRCGICRGLPASGVLHIDHEHVSGWADKPARMRARYVRGLACYRCNHFLLGSIPTVDLARSIVTYLEAAQARRDK